jgi:hypothetical protein
MTTISARAARADRVVSLYAGVSASPATALSELLCDLLFWSLREGVDFPGMLRLAIQVRDSEYLEARMGRPSTEQQ